MDLDMLQRRSAIIKQVRSFFDRKNYLELDTPLLSDNLIPESCLEVFQTERLFPRGSKKERRPLWLIPSPEIWMKKIIARHRVNVYQICKCFRNGESSGRLHNSEFTMLEYYTMNADYMDSLVLTEELFLSLTGDSDVVQEEDLPLSCGASKKKIYHEAAQSCTEEKSKEKLKLRDTLQLNSPCGFEQITVADAFAKWAGFDLFAAAEEGCQAMSLHARKLGLEPMPGMTVPELYDLIFIHAVEPQLKTQKPTALIDYPAFVPCLAKKKPDGRTVERWELYYNGVELANCYSEETNPQAVKDFFIGEEAEKQKNALVQHNIDHDYRKIFENFPRCSGVAMGLDRLIMALTGKTDIDGVLAFSV